MFAVIFALFVFYLFFCFVCSVLMQPDVHGPSVWLASFKGINNDKKHKRNKQQTINIAFCLFVQLLFVLLRFVVFIWVIFCVVFFVCFVFVCADAAGCARSVCLTGPFKRMNKAKQQHKKQNNMVLCLNLLSFIYVFVFFVLGGFLFFLCWRSRVCTDHLSDWPPLKGLIGLKSGPRPAQDT